MPYDSGFKQSEMFKKIKATCLQMDHCICEHPKNFLRYKFLKNFNIELSILKGRDSTNIIISHKKMVMATFGINYCPICGENLRGGLNGEFARSNNRTVLPGRELK